MALAALLAGTVALRAASTTSPAAATSVQLLMVEEEGCIWCARWNAEIGPIYPKTAEGRLAPLRRVDIRGAEVRSLALARPVQYTPTFVLMRDGRELGRIEGYPGEDVFWGLLGMLLREQLPEATAAAGL
ncbi:MAG: hypothetical protein D6811_02185 [Alphaproteobacteria bacterium]|nr:MAG: hypothetical protein D6811_02185 [Alphaproteobacteria bacterium]